MRTWLEQVEDVAQCNLLVRWFWSTHHCYFYLSWSGWLFLNMGYSSASQVQYSIRLLCCGNWFSSPGRKSFRSIIHKLCSPTASGSIQKWVSWDIWEASNARPLHLFYTYCVDILTNRGARQKQWNVAVNVLLQVFWLTGRSSFITDAYNDTDIFASKYSRR